METSRYELAVREVREAAKLLPTEEAADIAFEEKEDHSDIVSRYDKLLESYLAERILEAFPEDGIVGEEMAHPDSGEWIWYMDPIDGTANFVSQRKNYAISVGCYHNGTPAFGVVYDVEQDKLYHARAGEGAWCNDVPLGNGKRTKLSEMILYLPIVQDVLIREHPRKERMRKLAQDVRAVRSLGSVALEMCALAAGEADLFLAARSCPWDHNAARIILEETGGGLCTWDGGEVPVNAATNLAAAGKRTVLDQVAADYLM